MDRDGSEDDRAGSEVASAIAPARIPGPLSPNKTLPGPLAPGLLYRHCDPVSLPFETTASLADLGEIPGQERVDQAVRFGIGIKREGYNLFAMGPNEAGKSTLIRASLVPRAAAESPPPDLCYLHNFRQPHRPRAVVLPPGRGQLLARDLNALVDDLRSAIPAAFEGEEQRVRKEGIEEEVKERHHQALERLREDAAKQGVALLQTPLGLTLVPLKDGEVMEPEQFAQLPDTERARLEQGIEEQQARLTALIREFHLWAREARDKLKALFHDLAMSAVGHLIDELKPRWSDVPPVLEHLDAIRRDVVDNVGDFLHPPEGGGSSTAALIDPGFLGSPSPFRRYLVNLLVDNGEARGAPVIEEIHPTLANLLGRVEYQAHMGALLTDFHLIKPGALHRANGGYLMLDARNLLLQPYAWEGLKRVLRSAELCPESLGQMLSLVSTVSLEPESFPLSVKVVLVGERLLYYLLDAVDPEFRALFKVVADFEDDVERTPANDLLYARLVATIVRREKLRPFDRGAVARVIEQGARLAGDAERLSARLGAIADLLTEADFWARDAGRAVVSAEDVARAVAAAEERAGRVRGLVLDAIRRGTILLDTRGSAVGQVNALSVVQHGQWAFGRPSRITARVHLGKGEVIDIEREVALGGPLHSKGVLILSGFLAARYAFDHPLSLSATLVFEQSYGGVEGDSASCAELSALLSALAEVPIRQSLAMTGSVNQNGEVQPIGGVNEKVEGFFDACVAQGLTGEQGVIVPAANVKNLMLRADVVAAARDGRFHVHAVDDVDQALEILTGLPAGERDASGAFPPDSLNARVEQRLIALAERRVSFGRKAGREGEP
jgi:lon-related putative ATP-dependent protease